MTLQAQAANNKESGLPTGPVEQHWQSLQDQGIPVDYQAFVKRWKDEEGLPEEQQVLHKLVHDFDDTRLVVKTGEEPGASQNGGEQTGQVEKMAKRATDLGK